VEIMRLKVPYADPGIPDTRGPGRYLLWLVRKQPGRVCLGVLFASTWMVGLVVQPYLLARAIDDGLRPENLTALTGWILALLAAGAANATIAILRHRTMTFIRLDAGYRTVQVVIRHAAAVGAELPRRVSTGEVVSIGAADLERIMRTMTVTGPGVAAVITYAVVAVLLTGISPPLALVVLLGLPALMLALGPLLNRMRDTETSYREQQGALTARAGDIVAGLRVLCGIGGKERFAGRYHRDSDRLRAGGYRVGAVSSWIEAIAVGLPSLFLAAVTWLGARMAAAGDITVGELVAVYGYVAMLATPIWFLIEGAQDINRGLVAARRVTRVLTIRPSTPDHATAPCPAEPAPLHDPTSGLTVHPGELLVLAPARPADALAVADRLGRYTDSDATWGNAPLTAMPVAEVRRRVLVADNDAHLFAGPLRGTVTPGHPATDGIDDDAITHAIHTAAAEDIRTGLPDGLDSPVDAQGRDLSGGQRQRVRLVRALLADPEVLILVEPTSAVDAHTEAAIATRLREHRHGDRQDRTTVVVSTSPLLLDRADRVAYLLDGHVAATGTHTDLLQHEPGYRELAHRGEELVP
jgi:ABC-type multidrug transport system fused ATPase/permease subunit